MVDLVEEWEDIARYTRYLPENIRAGSSYQIKKSEDGIEIKARVCKYGYTEKSKKMTKTPNSSKILTFCQTSKFIRAYGSLNLL